MVTITSGGLGGGGGALEGLCTGEGDETLRHRLMEAHIRVAHGPAPSP